jgi:hypothetical protein
MVRALLLAAVVAAPFGAWAQDACSTHCNQAQSECLKACAGDPREASKPANREKLAACLKQCQAEATPCRQQCAQGHKTQPPAPAPAP